MQNIKNEKMWWEKLSKPALIDKSRCVSGFTWCGDKHTHACALPLHAPLLSTDFMLKSYSLINPMFAKSKQHCAWDFLKYKQADLMLYCEMWLHWNHEKTLTTWTVIIPPHHIVKELGFVCLCPMQVDFQFPDPPLIHHTIRILQFLQG